jgi:hypothetical protein
VVIRVIPIVPDLATDLVQKKYTYINRSGY